MTQKATNQPLSGTLLRCIMAVLCICSVQSVSAQCTATLTVNTTTSCQDSTFTLTASPAGLYDYQWFVNGQLGPLGIESWDYYAFIPGTYTFEVQITDFNNCTVISNPVTVTVHPNPMIGGTNYYNFACQGSNAQLGIDVDTATSFSWTGPNSYTATGQYPTVPNFQVTGIGIYTVIASNNGCNSYPYTIHLDTLSNTASVTADANVFSIDSNNTVCEGEPFDISANTQGFSSAGYSWTGPNNFTGTNDIEFFFTSTPADAGIYTVTVTGNTCSGTATVSDTVLINVVPPPFTSLTNNGPVCAGNTLQLNAVGGGGGTYQWIGPNGFMSNVQNPAIPNAQPSNSGHYTLIASMGGCEMQETMLDVHVMGTTPTVDMMIDTSNAVHCAGDYIFMNVLGVNGITNPSYLWTGPNFSSTNQFETFQISNNADSGMYVLTVSGNGCSGPTSVSESFLLDIRPCIWPGDVNNDMVTDNFDVLDLGLAYATQGPQRPNATYDWEGQYMADWGVLQFCGADMKFADCNGNGIITASDTFGISGNYSLTHLKGNYIPQAKSTADPDLYFDLTGIVLTPGSTVSIPIKLGTSTIPMQDVYGVAAQVKVSGITPGTGLTIDAPPGWMGSINDALNFTKYISDNQTDWAYVRTDHNNAGGEGTIAVMQLEIPAGTQYQQVHMYFDNVKIIGNTGNVITSVNILDDTATIYPTAMANVATIIADAVVLPNPSDAYAALQLTMAKEANVQVTVTDLTGRHVWSTSASNVRGTQQIALPAAELASGIYTIQVRDDKGALAKTMKWVRK